MSFDTSYKSWRGHQSRIINIELLSIIYGTDYCLDMPTCNSSLMTITSPTHSGWKYLIFILLINIENIHNQRYNNQNRGLVNDVNMLRTLICSTDKTFPHEFLKLQKHSLQYLENLFFVVLTVLRVYSRQMVVLMMLS